MARSAATKSGRRSDPALSEVARHLVLPDGVTSTGWPAVRDRAAQMGIAYDRWQDGLGRAILAKRDDGLYAAGVGGVQVSICRQVGKTFTIGTMVFALAINQPGLKAVWTAHRTRTSDETFMSLLALSRKKAVAPFVSKRRQANGQQEIAFTNGSRILFGARESGFGRGFDDVDVLVFDEAQILSQKALDDMVPATNVSANPLIIRMGTPPKPDDTSEAFTRFREDALAGKLQDGLYVEFSADSDADLDDRAQWRKANPSFPARTSEGALLRMRRQLGDESFRREGLGIWDESTTQHAIEPPAWQALTVGRDAVPAEGWRCFAVRFAVDGATVALGAAIRPPDGPIHVECLRVARMGEGTRWILDFLTDTERLGYTAQIVVEGKAGAGDLVNALRDAKVGAKVIIVPSVDQVKTAHAMFDAAIRDGTLTHLDDPELRAEVERATRRRISSDGGFGWKAPEGETVAGLDAVTLAHWAAKTTRRRPAGTRRRRGVIAL